METLIAWSCLALLLVRWAAQLALERLNQRHVLTHAGAVPDAFKDAINPAAYAKSIQYFWLSPVVHRWSRRFEYQADAFAASVMGESHSLKTALRKLSEKNLSNLTPHPLYSGLYYSHPTLLERERALSDFA